jgi:bifunctional hydroxylase/dehydrase
VTLPAPFVASLGDKSAVSASLGDKSAVSAALGNKSAVASAGPDWLGRRMPHRSLLLDDGTRVRVPDLLHHGRGVLIDTTGDQAHVRGADRFAGRVEVVRATWSPVPDGRESAPKAVLLRPDGYIAWMPEAGELTAALSRWFGAPDANHDADDTVDHLARPAT